MIATEPSAGRQNDRRLPVRFSRALEKHLVPWEIGTRWPFELDARLRRLGHQFQRTAIGDADVPEGAETERG